LREIEADARRLARSASDNKVKHAANALMHDTQRHSSELGLPPRARRIGISSDAAGPSSAAHYVLLSDLVREFGVLDPTLDDAAPALIPRLAARIRRTANPDYVSQRHREERKRLRFCYDRVDAMLVFGSTLGGPTSRRLLTNVAATLGSVRDPLLWLDELRATAPSRRRIAVVVIAVSANDEIAKTAMDRARRDPVSAVREAAWWATGLRGWDKDGEVFAIAAATESEPWLAERLRTWATSPERHPLLR
jgi:hypothetical protein